MARIRKRESKTVFSPTEEDERVLRDGGWTFLFALMGTCHYERWVWTDVPGDGTEGVKDPAPVDDRTLLARAAKAALKAGAFRHLYEGLIHEETGVQVILQSGREAYWNPLKDDGDAFRLAVALRMDINTGAQAPGVLSDGIDLCAATRRSIVVAAAEMAGGSNNGR